MMSITAIHQRILGLRGLGVRLARRYHARADPAVAAGAEATGAATMPNTGRGGARGGAAG